MKKIININLSGRVIPIEDSAYEKLQAYIESLRRYFAHEEGRDEIINDIESRIAELMNDKIRKGASCVTDADIAEISASMGTPEDLDAEALEPNEATGQKTGNEYREQTEGRRRKRLYRDSGDKFIGGVCSGIANYLNTDPAIVRILFAIITFGGFGLGFLIYILLWIFLPDRDLDGYAGKRLFRNPDDRVIGGVAGGLAAYFNTRASTVRLIFAAPLLFSILLGLLRGFTWHYDFDFVPNIIFGSLSGTFILAYVVLWIVLPEANSPYEKMEMRGEKVDVNTIRRNMQERIKEWGEEVKDTTRTFGTKAKEFAGDKAKAFSSEVQEAGRRANRGLGHAIMVIFKAFFLFIAGTIAFSLFVAAMALVFGGVAWWPVNNFLWTSDAQQAYAWGTLIFFLFVPLVGFIVWIIRRILRVRSRNSYMGWIFGGLWTIGWVVMILFVTSIAKDFREYEHIDNTVTLTQPVSGKMIVAVSQPELEYTGGFGWMNEGSEGWDLSEDTIRIAAVDFNVRASADDQYRVTLKRYGFGRTEEDALERAGRIRYDVVSRDSVLDLGNGYTVDKESKFRGQYVELDIQVPVGKKIRFDESVRQKLNNVDVKVRRDYRRNRNFDIRINEEERSFHYRSGIDYVMDVDGTLKDPGGHATGEPGTEYRYPGTGSGKQDSLQRIIDEEKRKREESDRKIRELEKKQQDNRTGSSKKHKEILRGVGFGPAPVAAMVQWL